jgi:peptidoglycan/LPS O-acetylase OafA/YrhL
MITELRKESFSDWAQPNGVTAAIPPDASNCGKIFFPNLDGFRFLSFLLVYLHHAFSEVRNSLGEGGFIFTTIKLGIFQSAPLGVSFFFVLSGFLITYLLLAEKQQQGQVDVKAFYWRRILRIWPLYFALLAVVFVLLPWLTDIKLPNLIYYLFFLANFDVLFNPDAATGITDIMWSVAVEEQFYLLWPLLFYVLGKNSQLYLLLGLILFSAAFRWGHRLDDRVQHFHTLSVMSELVIGSLAAYGSLHFARFRQALANLSRWKIVLIYSVALPAILFSRILYSEEVFGRMVLGALLVFIILEQNFCRNSFYKMGNFRRVTAWGKYTYGLYMLHPLLIFLVYAAADYAAINKSEMFTGTVLALASFLLSLFVCYLSYHYFEAPFLNLKKRFSRVAVGVA